MKRAPVQLIPVIFLVFIILLFYVFMHVQSQRLAYKIGKMRAALDAEKAENGRLHIKLSRLSSPERLDSVAREMGFSAPSRSRVIEIRKKDESDK